MNLSFPSRHHCLCLTSCLQTTAVPHPPKKSWPPGYHPCSVVHIFITEDSELSRCNFYPVTLPQVYKALSCQDKTILPVGHPPHCAPTKCMVSVLPNSPSSASLAMLCPHLYPYIWCPLPQMPPLKNAPSCMCHLLTPVLR